VLKLAVNILLMAGWLVATAAWAQAPIQQETAASSRLNLTLEQEHVIKEWIKDLKIEPSADAAKSVGDVVAAEAPRPMPADVGQKVPQVKAHRFVYTAERILIVDPKDNKVAEVIELN
jgi:Na+-transporting NADH:ubiquinone oxidoreductase subunit NqrC